MMIGVKEMDPAGRKESDRRSAESGATNSGADTGPGPADPAADPEERPGLLRELARLAHGPPGERPLPARGAPRADPRGPGGRPRADRAAHSLLRGHRRLPRGGRPGAGGGGRGEPGGRAGPGDRGAGYGA